ncbi:MAG: tRNA (guanosine(37)-N1)-methyltransferase TrmD [Nitrospinae bacterium]|nr:tRNA (guanosine(37)-N1)-methyltransferase TrmD [Nitrospinota bacterium]
MRFDIVTIFPGMFAGPLDSSIIGRARDSGKIQVNVHDLRGWTTDKHRITDDYPYGGGAGMVMKVEPFAAAVAQLKTSNPAAKVILMSPAGTVLRHSLAMELSRQSGIIILCGRYEGVDARVTGLLCDMEVSIGDYVLTGGEIPAMALVDCVARLVPGVVGEEQSTVKESHAGNLLEYPQYTRPPEFEGLKVPEILLSGDHAKIEKWRREQAIIKTARVRPALLDKAGLSEDEMRTARKAMEEKGE